MAASRSSTATPMWSIRPNTCRSLRTGNGARREDDPVATAALDLCQRALRADQQVVVRAGVADGDADGDRRAQAIARLRLQLPGELLRRAAALGLEHQRELVAADAVARGA